MDPRGLLPWLRQRSKEKKGKKDALAQFKERNSPNKGGGEEIRCARTVQKGGTFFLRRKRKIPRPWKNP